MKQGKLFYKGIVIGLLTGILVTIYRLTLGMAEDLNLAVYEYLKNHTILIPFWFTPLIVFALFVGFLIKKNPLIGGSGVPQAKGVIFGYFQGSPIAIIVSKFIGGTVAIFSGLSLGCCGPSAQMGACIGEKLSRDKQEKPTLMASGATAGLAAAFNAPVSGILFSMEELLGRFSPVIFLPLVASALSADFVSKAVFGLEPIFSFASQYSISLSNYWIVVSIGVIVGAFGAFYNWTLINVQKFYKNLPALNLVTRPIIPFVVAGILGLTFPVVLGSGHNVLATITVSTPIYVLLAILIVKFCFSIISFVSGAPGGIFFPLLVIGASIGMVFGKVLIMFSDLNPLLLNNIIVLAMVGSFTAIVRTPITGVVLLMEMTGSFSNVLPLVIVSFVSAVVANSLKSEPICTSLLKGMLTSRDKTNTLKI